MSSPSTEVFRLSWRSPLVASFALFFAVLCALAWPHLNLVLALIVQFVVALALLLLFSVASVTQEGIVLYFVNRLEWPQVTGVRRVSFLGLPYLHITRAKGLNCGYRSTSPGLDPLRPRSPKRRRLAIRFAHMWHQTPNIAFDSRRSASAAQLRR